MPKTTGSMLDQELQKLWQQAPSEMQIKFNQSKLMIDLDRDIRKFERTLFWRDIREIVPAVLMTGYFGRIVYYEPDMIAKIGFGFLILGSLLVIVKLLVVKRFKSSTPSDAPFQDYLKQRYQYLSKEKRLLETVLYWYISPFLIGYAILGLGLPLNIPHWGAWIFYIFYLAFGFGVSWFIRWLNDRAVVNQFNPILERIENTLENLESP
ncbi:hypothetical protein [Tunicatimonas pelagia]|uniref:hypothetical protein n=1 Tax=Tunicatimonas pelagia TaxID=931531 RepID=UPI0026658AFE|nr:hypothetical protein [Tunicatimonas pelagia]WKN44724.1 hypothetical protein P0M28_07070 [Tunicatimonas pelagia]